ncbi:MAG TPA: hypothetical protein DCS07_10950 [Bdellovibrionales bacterium]|nr:hypothetical protein [Bdellovibrionales bacterium]
MAGSAEAFSSIATRSSSVSKVSVFLDATTKATKLIVGIYRDNYGHPGSLLSQASVSAVPGRWNILSIPAVSLTSGQKYWIALLGLNGTLAFRDVVGAGPCETSKSSGLLSLPATWITGQVYTEGKVSAFAY